MPAPGSSTLVLVFVVLLVCLAMLLLSPQKGREPLLRDAGPVASPTNVRDLRNQDEARALMEQSGARGLLLIHTPWCGHCKNMMPEYEAAATALAGSGAVLARLEASESCREFLTAQDIKGFPTIIVLGQETRYSGARTREALTAFVKTL